MTTYLRCRIPTVSGKREISSMEDIPQIPVMEELHFELNLTENNEQCVHIYDRNYEKNLLVLEGEVLFNRARKLWKHMENMIVNDKPIPATVFQDVQEVVRLLLYTAQNISSSKYTSAWDFQQKGYSFVKLLKASITNVSKLRDNLTNKLTCNSVCLKSEPICEYFHLYLSIKYLILYVDNLIGQEEEEGNIKNVMLDLTSLSRNIYTKNKDNYMNIEPFFCVCVKKLWLYLIHYLKQTKKFWTIYNDVISDPDEEFTIWLLYHISLLHLYDATGNLIGISNDIQDNYDLVTRCLQSVTSTAGVSERKMLNVLKFTNPILTELWIHNSKLEPYQILWEYFYKNLDNNSISDIKIPKNVREMLDVAEKLKSNSKSLENPYEYYLFMLSSHMKKNAAHWNKMRGRIYSRLPMQKVNNFGNKAIYQISLLFLTLFQAGINEAVDKLYGLLENLPKDRQESELVWIIYLTLMITYIRENRDIRQISKSIQSQIEEVASSREKFYLLKHYITAMDVIMNSSQNYDLGQNILLGSWISPYMNTCTYTDLCQILDSITCIIIQIETCGKWYEFKHCFIEYVLPALKRIAVSNTSPTQAGELAGKICLNTQEIIQSTIQYFSNTSVNIKVTYSFLVTILRNNSYLNFSFSEENLLISSWFRICILCPDVSHKDLSVYIFKLPSVRTFIAKDDFEGDPYTEFVKTLSIQMESQMNLTRLKEFCEICFGNVDQWLNGFLTPYTSDTQTTYLYTTISLFFYRCSPLLYHKSKSTCLFNRLVTLLLLPTEVLMGKPPPSNILKAIEKTWHLFVRGVYKLGHSSDPYVDRTLKDIVVRYVPHFPSTNSPILKILDEPKIAIVVLDKIANAFLLKSARSSEENTFKALKIIQNILSNTTEECKIVLVLERTLLGILEVIMFTNQRTLALDLIKSLISSGWYEQVQTKLQTSLQTVTDRHLAFNTSNYFQLVGNMINIIPSSVRMVLPHIKKQISHVEKMRGVGFDNTLRQGLDRIEKALS